MALFDYYTLKYIAHIMLQEENRGHLRKESYSDEIQELSKNIKTKREELHCTRKVDKEKSEHIKEEITILKQKIDDLKQKEQKIFFDTIVNSKHKIQIAQTVIKDKYTYTTKDVQSMIVSRIISKELARAYNLKPTNRDFIIEQLISLLDNPMSKVVLRIDIKNFFESICQESLMSKLIDDGFISSRSISYLKTFMYEYNNKSGNRIGVPRGLSFSSYLSEVFMMSIDKRISNINGVFFYKRYVDDIIVVANPKLIGVKELWDTIEDVVSDSNLQIHKNSDKAYKAIWDDKVNNEKFEYLGYSFSFYNGNLRVLISDKRYNKYIKTIDAVFEIYAKCAASHKKKDTAKKGGASRRHYDPLLQLINRLKVLTGNGLLSGRKNYVATGIYYSNKYINDNFQLKRLDDYIESVVDDCNKFNPPNSLFNYSPDNNYSSNIDKIKAKLKSIKFSENFEKPKLKKNIKYVNTLKDLHNIYYKKINE